MKVKEHIDKNACGKIVIIPEESEDLWHLFQMIHEGDKVKCKTMRKIKVERGAGKMESSRSVASLELECMKTDFDPVAGSLRVSGKVCNENKLVSLGQFHTMDIDLHHPVTIYKEEWDSVYLQVLKDAKDERKKADVVAVLIDQREARIILITPYMSLEKFTISIAVSSKRFDDNPQKKLHKSFDNIITGLLQIIDWDIVKCILIAGPGFTKTQFKNYFVQKAQLDEKMKLFWKNKNRLLLVDASSSHYQVLFEVLKDASVQNALSDTKAIAEIQALTRFMKVMRDTPDLAVYGFNDVLKAAEYGAIDTILITDELIRVANVEKRKAYVNITEQVKSKGGEVRIFSVLHNSGAQLKGMTGIAAILRYPIQLDNDSDEDSEDD